MNSYHQVNTAKELQKNAKTLIECRIGEYYGNMYYLEYRS